MQHQHDISTPTMPTQFWPTPQDITSIVSPQDITTIVYLLHHDETALQCWNGLFPNDYSLSDEKKDLWSRIIAQSRRVKQSLNSGWKESEVLPIMFKNIHIFGLKLEDQLFTFRGHSGCQGGPVGFNNCSLYSLHKTGHQFVHVHWTCHSCKASADRFLIASWLFG